MYKQTIIKYFYEGDKDYDYIVYFANQDVAYKALGFMNVQKFNMRFWYQKGFMNDYTEDKVERVGFLPRQYQFNKPFRVTKSVSTIDNYDNMIKCRNEV